MGYSGRSCLAGPWGLGGQGCQECLAGPSAQSHPSCHTLEDPGDLRQEGSEKGNQETQVIRKEEITVMVNNRNALHLMTISPATPYFHEDLI